MDTTDAVKLFRNNWFRRNEEHLELTPAEEQLITAALGRAPKRWSGAPDVERMEKILADEPSVLDRIGAQLLQVVIGMKGCGPAVQLLLDRGVPLEIEAIEYNVLHEASWGGMTDTLQAVFEAGCGGRDWCLGTQAAHRLARQPLPHVLDRLGWIRGACQALDPLRRRRSPRVADQRKRRAGYDLPAGSRRA